MLSNYTLVSVSFRHTTPAHALIAALLLSGAFSAHAQVMSSPSYQIEFDSINIAGGLATSDSYVLEDTVGEFGTGRSVSANFQLRAGYQQMNETYLALSPPQNVSLTPSIGGLTGGTANGSTTFIVTTDSLAGYEVTIEASSTPAMNHVSTSTSIDDYTPQGLVPDYDFTVAATSSEFGFSPEGDDIATRYENSGTMCGVSGTDAEDQCWDGLSMSVRTIVSRPTSNHPAGTETKLKFRAEVGAQARQLAGDYRATTTITVLAL